MLAAFIPLWTITLLGWAAARFGWFNASAQRALTSFAFHLAIPSVIFATLVKLPLAHLPLVPLAAFAISTVIIFTLAYAAARLVVRGERGDRVIAAMASSYVNSGNLGIPVAVYVLRDVSLVVAIVAFQTVVVTPLIVGALDAGGTDVTGRWRRILLLPFRVPVVAASLLGTVFTLSGLTLPDVVLRPFEILGGAAAPIALFALGMALSPGARKQRAAAPPESRRSASSILQAKRALARSTSRNVGAALRYRRGQGLRNTLLRKEIGVIAVAKLILQPLVAYAAARWLFGLGGVELIAVTIFAGLPTAQNTFVYATQYKVPNGLSRDAVLVTSVLSLVSLSLILWLLSH